MSRKPIGKQSRPARKPAAKVHPALLHLKTVREEHRNRRECELVSFLWWHANPPPRH